MKNPHTAKGCSTPDPWGGRNTVWAVEPRGLRDAIAVLFGVYDARVWVKAEKCRDCAEVRWHEHCAA